jgi:hypothetical protein
MWIFNIYIILVFRLVFIIKSVIRETYLWDHKIPQNTVWESQVYMNTLKKDASKGTSFQEMVNLISTLTQKFLTF